MPNTLALSVSASAGIEYAAAFATASSMRTIPSVTEYSLCSLRWTNRGAFTKKFYPFADRPCSGDDRLRLSRAAGFHPGDLVDRFACVAQPCDRSLGMLGRKRHHDADAAVEHAVHLVLGHVP